MTKTATVLLIATLASVSALSGQTGPRHLGLDTVPVLQDPSTASSISTPSPVAILEGTAKSKSVTARIGMQAADFLLDVKLSGPLDDHETQLASLRGLGGSTTLSVGLGWIRWHPNVDPAAAQAVCDAYIRETRQRLTTCTHLDLPEGQWRRRFDSTVHYGTPLILSLRGTLGRGSFTWIDTTSLARSIARHTVSSLDASLGLYRSGVGFFLLSYAYELSYSASDPVQICRPLGATGALRCDDLPVQSPSRNRSSLISFEYRRLVGTAVGLRPVVTYRTSSKVWGCQLPLYFLRDQQGFTGGVALGWRSDTKEATVTAFVGDVLGLVKGP
jgi:hypothetical protein